ncbi:MAG: hypothetical protein INR64_12675 [Caulobacteraceae bacterium]|nr:hypothetical protein [Caulobacter sp.]
MSEQTPVPADIGFRCAIQLICTAERLRSDARALNGSLRRSVESVARLHSADAVALIVKGVAA